MEGKDSLKRNGEEAPDTGGIRTSAKTTEHKTGVNTRAETNEVNLRH